MPGCMADGSQNPNSSNPWPAYQRHLLPASEFRGRLCRGQQAGSALQLQTLLQVLVSRPGTSGGWQECVLDRFVDANPQYSLRFVQFTNLLSHAYISFLRAFGRSVTSVGWLILLVVRTRNPHTTEEVRSVNSETDRGTHADRPDTSDAATGLQHDTFLSIFVAIPGCSAWLITARPYGTGQVCLSTCSSGGISV